MKKFDGAIDYNVRGYSRALYFNFTMKGLYHPDNFIREKLEADASETDTPEITAGTRKPGNRGERRRATKNHKKHLTKIEPFTDSVKEARNGGLYHRGNTFRWHPVWKKMDRRITRHDGKNICWKYHEDEPAAVENYWVDDDPCYGHWDVESQMFIPDSNDADGFFTGLEDFPEEIQEIMIDLRIARENFDDAQKRLMFAKEALDYQTSRLMAAFHK